MNIYDNLIDQTIKGIVTWILKVTQYRAQDVTDNDTLNAAVGTLQTQVAANTAAISGAVTIPAPGTSGNVPVSNGSIWVSQALTVPIPFMHIGGLILSGITGTHTTAAFSISKGGATDSTGAAYISSSGSLSWAAANGNAINGTDAASSTLTNSTTYHVFLCTGASGTGSFVSSSLTPTFPTGYAVSSRRIGSFLTNGSGAPIPYTSIESEGGAVINWLTTQVLDISATTTTANRTLYTLSLPSGVKNQWLYRLNISAVGNNGTLITSPDETDVATTTTSGSTTVPGADTNNTGTGSFGAPRDGIVTTNTSGQIGIRSNAATGVACTTRGWKDFRRA